MPRRQKPLSQEPSRKSERIRLRKEAEAAEAARIANLEQQEPEPLAETPKRNGGQKSRTLNGVASGGGVSRRTRTPRRTSLRNMPATYTPFVNGPTAQALFGRFMDGIFHAALESYQGEVSGGPTENPNRDEQPTQSQIGWVSGQELHPEDAPITEELDIIVSLQSSDSEPDLV